MRFIYIGCAILAGLGVSISGTDAQLEEAGARAEIEFPDVGDDSAEYTPPVASTTQHTSEEVVTNQGPSDSTSISYEPQTEVRENESAKEDTAAFTGVSTGQAPAVFSVIRNKGRLVKESFTGAPQNIKGVESDIDAKAVSRKLREEIQKEQEEMKNVQDSISELQKELATQPRTTSKIKSDEIVVPVGRADTFRGNIPTITIKPNIDQELEAFGVVALEEAKMRNAERMAGSRAQTNNPYADVATPYLDAHEAVKRLDKLAALEAAMDNEKGIKKKLPSFSK